MKTLRPDELQWEDPTESQKQTDELKEQHFMSLSLEEKQERTKKRILRRINFDAHEPLFTPGWAEEK